MSEYAQRPGYASSFEGATTRRSGRPFTIASFVCAAVAIVVLPLFVGIAGVVLGIVGRSRGDRLANWAIVASIVGAAIGMVLAYVIWRDANDDALAVATVWLR